jgi:DNA (cytosine-5)-methyltransferase 1
MPAVAFAPEVTGTLVARSSRGGGQTNSPGHQADQHVVATAMQVRRLTPRECERLQGFPDDYTLIPHRGRDAADGPRYKALGNSWAVPCVRWIGQRIDACRHSSIGEQQ